MSEYNNYKEEIRHAANKVFSYIGLNCPDCGCHEIKKTDDNQSFICVNCKRYFELSLKEIK